MKRSIHLKTLISSLSSASLLVWKGGLVLSTQAHVPPFVYSYDRTLETNVTTVLSGHLGKTFILIVKTIVPLLASFCSMTKNSQKDAPSCYVSVVYPKDVSFNSFLSHILISRSGLLSSEGSLVLIMDAEGPWLTPKGETAGDRAANGDSDGEKLGDIAAEEIDPS